MKITSIGLTNFKGQNQSVSLGRLNMITGPNGSGKSAIPQALAFVIEGHADTGNTAEAKAKLGVNGNCSVAIFTDSDQSFGRGIETNHQKGTVKEWVNVNGEPVKRAVGSAAIKEACGDFAPMFRLSEFLDLSDDKARAFVLNLCAQAGEQGGREGLDLFQNLVIEICRDQLGAGTVGAHVLARAGTAWPDIGNPKDRTRILDELLLKLPKDFRSMALATLEEMVKDAPDDIAEALGHFVTVADREKNAARKSKDEGCQAARKLSESKNALTVISGQVSDIIAEQEEMEQQKAECAEQLAKQGGAVVALEEVRRGLARAQAWRDEIGERLSEVEAGDGGHRDRTERIGRLEKGLANHPAIEMHEARADAVRAKEAVKGFAADHIERRNALHQARMSLDAAQHLKQRREGDLAACLVHPVTQAQEAFKALKAFCGAEGRDLPKDHAPAWDRLETAIGVLVGAANDPAIAEIGVKGAGERLPEREGRLAEAEAEEAAAVERLDAATIARDALDEAVERAKQKKTERDKKRKEAQKSIAKMQLEEQGYQSQKKQVDSDLKSCGTRLLESSESVNRLRAALGEVDPKALRDQIQGLTDRMITLAEKIRAKREWGVLEKKLAETQADAEAQGVRYDAANAAGRAARIAREGLMTRMVEPLTAAANDFLEYAQPGFELYVDLANQKGRAIFDLGWIDPGATKISYATLSNGERATLGAALAFALVELAAPPCKMLLLEAGELDAKGVHALTRAIGAMGDRLDTVIVCRWGEGLGELEGWTSIEMKAPEPIEQNPEGRMAMAERF